MAQACRVYVGASLREYTDISETVVKARILSVNPAKVTYPGTEQAASEDAFILTLSTLYTFKGARAGLWRVAVRAVPTYGVGSAERWARRVGEVYVFGLAPPGTATHSPSLDARLPPGPRRGLVRDETGEPLPEVASRPCASHAMLAPDIWLELRVLSIAQRDLLLCLLALWLGWLNRPGFRYREDRP